MLKNKVLLNKIKQTLEQYNGIDYAFIFGSAVKGKLLPSSDIDILIGGDLNFSTRVDIALKLETLLRRRTDIVLAKEAAPELVLTAFSQGKCVLKNSRERVKEDYFRNFYLYEDSAGLRRMRTARIKREVTRQ